MFATESSNVGAGCARSCTGDTGDSASEPRTAPAAGAKQERAITRAAVRRRVDVGRAWLQSRWDMGIGMWLDDRSSLAQGGLGARRR